MSGSPPATRGAVVDDAPAAPDPWVARVLQAAPTSASTTTAMVFSLRALCRRINEHIYHRARESFFHTQTYVDVWDLSRRFCLSRGVDQFWDDGDSGTIGRGAVSTRTPRTTSARARVCRKVVLDESHVLDWLDRVTSRNRRMGRVSDAAERGECARAAGHRVNVSAPQRPREYAYRNDHQPANRDQSKHSRLRSSWQTSHVHVQYTRAITWAPRSTIRLRGDEADATVLV